MESVWDAPNVFVTDGAAMASASCVNPSLTYMAMTARAANYAVNELKKELFNLLSYGTKITRRLMVQRMAMAIGGTLVAPHVLLESCSFDPNTTIGACKTCTARCYSRNHYT